MPTVRKTKGKTFLVDDSLITSILQNKIPKSSSNKKTACITYMEFIGLLVNITPNVLISGGLVRDIVEEKEIDTDDIDIDLKVFTPDTAYYIGKDEVPQPGENYRDQFKQKYIKLIRKNKLSGYIINMPSLDYTYFFVGCDPNVNCEGQVDCTRQETPGNSLMLNPYTMEIIDPTGYGISDARKRIWRKNPDISYDQWGLNNPTVIIRLTWRMIKFKSRGFTTKKDDVNFLYDSLLDICHKVGPLVEGNVITETAFKKDVANAYSTIKSTDVLIEILMKDSKSTTTNITVEEMAFVVNKILSSGGIWQTPQSVVVGNEPYRRHCLGQDNTPITRPPKPITHKAKQSKSPRKQQKRQNKSPRRQRKQNKSPKSKKK